MIQPRCPANYCIHIVLQRVIKQQVVYCVALLCLTVISVVVETKHMADAIIKHPCGSVGRMPDSQSREPGFEIQTCQVYPFAG